jgi:hypothetical protein
MVNAGFASGAGVAYAAGARGKAVAPIVVGPGREPLSVTSGESPPGDIAGRESVSTVSGTSGAGRISGRQPVSSGSGNEPDTKISGREP